MNLLTLISTFVPMLICVLLFARYCAVLHKRPEAYIDRRSPRIPLVQGRTSGGSHVYAKGLSLDGLKTKNIEIIQDFSVNREFMAAI